MLDSPECILDLIKIGRLVCTRDREGREAPPEYLPVPRPRYDLCLLDDINLTFEVIASRKGSLSGYQQIGLSKLPGLLMTCMGQSKSVRHIFRDPVERSPPINERKVNQRPCIMFCTNGYSLISCAEYLHHRQRCECLFPS